MQTPLSLRQQGNCRFICVSFFCALRAQKTKHKRIKYRCESTHLGHGVTPIIYKQTKEALILSARDMARKERKQYGKK
jgi:uncharacterized DUF497 family protein